MTALLLPSAPSRTMLLTQAQYEAGYDLLCTTSGRTTIVHREYVLVSTTWDGFYTVEYRAVCA